MNLDSYSICPGGCGKKIKFCCGKDVTADLNKIIASITGDQKLAAIGQLQAARKKHGDKPCFLALEIDLYFALEKIEEAHEVLKILRTQNPKNPVGLALDAIVRLTKGEIDEAVEQLQRAVEFSDGQFSGSVVQAFRHIGMALFMQRKITASRAHLLVFDQLTEHRDQEVSQVLARTMLSPEVPILLKHDYALKKCPDDVEWLEEFNEAFETAMSGRWLMSLEKFDELAKKYPNQPEIGFNIAVLESKLGDAQEMAAAWSHYADTDGVPEAAAVEAEALAQTIDTELDSRQLDEIELTIEIKDQEKLVDVLTSNKRFTKLPFDPQTWAKELGPAPRSAYSFLDKPMPEVSDDLKFEEVPNIVGELMVFGKQTDIEARCVIALVKTDEFDEMKKQILTELGETVDASTVSEEVVGEVSAIAHSMTFSIRFPDGISMEKREEFTDQNRRNILFDVWPNMPLDELDGKSPVEASQDSYFKIPLLGAILILELSMQRSAKPIDFNPLREKLNLPKLGLTDPDTVQDFDGLSLLQMTQLDFSKLTDEQLVRVFEIVGMATAGESLRRLCEEIVGRPSVQEKVDLQRVYSILARLEPDNDKAIQYVRKVRDITIAKGESPASSMIEELEIRIQRGMVDECAQLMREIETRHMREPGIARALMTMLMRYGVIDGDGNPAFREGDPAEGELVGTSTESQSSEGKLWTPESESESGGGKLWTPD